MRNANTKRKAHITKPREAAAHLETHFCSPAWEAAHVGAKINKVVVTFIEQADIPREVRASQYERLVGQKSSYGYIPLRTGIALARGGSCWCPDGCMRARGPGEGLTADFCCEECTGLEPKWTEHSVARSDPAGVGNRRAIAQANGHKHAAGLEGKAGVGRFIIVQAREQWSMSESVHRRAGHYWLARTVETAPGSGTCLEKITDRRKTIDETAFTMGDYAISVEWFHRVADDAMGLSFTKWIPDDPDDPGMPSVLNSTELRAVEGKPIDPTQTDGCALSLHRQAAVEPVLVPPPRQSPRLASNTAKAAGVGVGVLERLALPSAPLDAVWEVRELVDAASRNQCW